MAKPSPIRKFYKEVTQILFEDLPDLPPFLKLSNAKGYRGQIKRIGSWCTSITVSKHYYDGDYDPKWWFDMETLLDLLDTICHELAHMTYWEHSPEHKELTAKYLEKVMVIYNNYQKLAQVA